MTHGVNMPQAFELIPVLVCVGLLLACIIPLIFMKE